MNGNLNISQIRVNGINFNCTVHTAISLHGWMVGWMNILIYGWMDVKMDRWIVY